MMKRIIAILALLSLAACGGGGSSAPSATYSAKSGVAQKGPLIKGSTVTAQELDSSLSPTGKQYSYQTTSDFGAFSPTNSFASQYIGTNASGYYFDEVANAVSTGPVTLNGYSDLSTDTVLNVNLLTTLEYQRIQNLVTKSNMTFAAARTQAENEVLTALNIPVGSYGAFSTLDVSGGTDGDHILAAISSIFVYGNSAGPLSQLIANFQSDIGANGVITNAKTIAALVAAAQAVNPAAVAANFTTFYAADGVVFTASDISDWISQSGDGVIGKFAFQVADATPSSLFTFPAFVVSSVAGTSISVTAGQLSVNGTPVTGAVTVQATDVLTVSPGVGDFPNGVLTVYLVSGTTKTARVSFVSGLLSIAVTPGAPGIPLGLTQQFKATGTFSDSSTTDLTSSVSWSSGTPATATVNAASGLATSVAVGSTVITATSGSVSGSATLNIGAAALESMIVTASAPSVGITNTVQLTAIGTYSDSSSVNVTTVATWSSSDPTLASVGPSTGVVTGVALGSVTITAVIGTVSGTTMLTVIATTWHPAANMSVARSDHAAALLSSGVVLASGGEGVSNTPLASAELYDPVANAWSAAGNLATARLAHTATTLASGLVLAAGGGGLNGALASCELYSSATNTWSVAASMTFARESHTATLLSNGQVLAVEGGQTSSATSSAELYDPVANTWALAASPANARVFGHTATLLTNGKVLVVGGYGAGSLFLSSAELYDPVANTWTAEASLATARGGHSATLLPNGTVLVAGGTGNGATPGSAVPIASAEIYDPVANTWSPAASLPSVVWAHTATLLQNGLVLVAGGTNGSEALTSAELYDPVANSWTATSSLITARVLYTATLLQSGQVLAAGGANEYALSSAELYP
jgi:N-acetylneuraminic acid mutarotase